MFTKFIMPIYAYDERRGRLFLITHRGLRKVCRLCFKLIGNKNMTARYCKECCNLKAIDKLSKVEIAEQSIKQKNEVKQEDE